MLRLQCFEFQQHPDSDSDATVLGTTSHSTDELRFLTRQAKAYAALLADVPNTIVSSNEFQDGSSVIHQLGIDRYYPLVRAPGGRRVVSQPPLLLYKIENYTITMTASMTPPRGDSILYQRDNRRPRIFQKSDVPS